MALAEAPRSEIPRPVIQTVETPPAPVERPQYPVFRFYPNGLIDIAPDINRYPDGDSNRLGIEYQEIAMSHVDSTLPDGVMALGSHLLDLAILKTPLAALGRPDVMVFHQGRLDSIFEFKRTWHTEASKKMLREKLQRVSRLLRALRKNPTFLGDLIRERTGQDILPESIRIPKDSRLKPLVFVSSSGWDGEPILTSDNTKLRGKFLMVPVPAKPSALIS